MARARLTHELMPMASAGRGQIIVAFKRAARVLGVPKPVLELVLYLASRTQGVDWQEDGRPLAHPSNRDLEVELGVGRTRIKSLIRQAAELGFLVCSDSPTGHRYARRDRETGHIVAGYGFDLSPLSRRYDEFRAAISAHEEREREGKRLRRHIMAQYHAVRALAECLQNEGLPDPELDAHAAEAASLAASRADEWNPTILSLLADRLDTIEATAVRRLALVLPVESDPAGDREVAPITSTNLPTSAYASRNAEGRSAPSAFREKRSSISEASLASQSNCPLRGFQVSPGLVLQLAPMFRDLCSSSRPSQAQIVDAAAIAAGSIGVSPHAWGQACHALGRWAAAVAVAIIVAKRERGQQIISPGGYLRKITANHLAGELHLDRTLFGLVEGTGPRGRA